MSALRRATALLAFMLVAVASAADASAQNAPRPFGDDGEIATMRARSPEAAEALAQGEAFAASRALAEAEAAFSRGIKAYPDGALLWRKRCEVLVERGRHLEAVDACAHALERAYTNANVRALVHALVWSEAPPTPTELVQASLLITEERRRAPGQPTAAAAACDIAERLGDGIMLERCAAELTKIAPDDPATARALVLLHRRTPLWPRASAFALIALSALGTLVHAVARRSRRARRVVIAAAAAAAVALSLAVASFARADPAQGGWLSRWPVDDQAPDRSIPTEAARNAEPLEFGYWLQDLALKAERASKRGDHAAAARFYAALSTAVPDRAVGFVKACEELEALGDREGSVRACGNALLREGTVVRDYTRFVRLLVEKSGPLDAKESAALDRVLDHMKDDPAARDALPETACIIAVRTSSDLATATCDAAVADRGSDDARTAPYRWALAIRQARFDEATRILDRAAASGLDASAQEPMRRATRDARDRADRRLALGALAAILLVVAAAIAGRAAMQMRRRLAARAAA